MDWLERYAFPEEARFADLDYAERAYSRFVEDMRRGPNTRACVFASAHTEATLLLMDLLDESGLATMVGRVSTVSYTHLDVYKRQEPERWCRELRAALNF